MEHTKLTDGDVNRMRHCGHTFAPHIDATASINDPDADDLYFGFPEALRQQTAAFKKRFEVCSATLQSHYAPWLGYTAWVPKHIDQGYRMLFTYLGLRQEPWGRFACGSGRPLRFFDPTGIVYDCWQQPILFYDDSSIVEWMRSFEEPVEVFDTLADSLNSHYSAVGCLSHPVSFATYSQPVMEHIMDGLKSRNIPICSGDAWLDFNDRRNKVVLDCEIQNNHLVVAMRELKGQLMLMIPGAARRVIVQDVTISTVSKRVLSEAYTFVQLNESTHGNRPVIHVC